MPKLKLYFRIRQRQHSDPMDYFKDIMAKYGDSLRFGEVTTTYIPLAPDGILDARKQHFLIADTHPHASLVLRELVGEMEVRHETEARDIATNSEADHCYAEYVVPYRIEKEPE